MYKGVGPPLLSLSIVNTLSFTSYSYFRQNLFHGKDGWDYKNALSGMMGAPVFGLVTTPENFIKTQMQLDNVQVEREKARQTQQQLKMTAESLQKTQGRFTSSLQCARTLVSSHGPTILYTGHVINTIREAAFVGAYFFCYEGFKCEFKKLLMEAEKMFSSNKSYGNNPSSMSVVDDSDNSSWSSSLSVPLAGGLAGATSWFLTFPMDCVRAGVQGQLIPTSSSGPIQHQGAIETCTHLLRTKGLTALYAGVAPSIARAFLVSGSRFSAYEGSLYLCRLSGFTDGPNEKYNDGPGSYEN
jgi:solute carrier family 25 carnitine/acylcarnitine transporter 20/29